MSAGRPGRSRAEPTAFGPDRFASVPGETVACSGDGAATAPHRCRGGTGHRKQRCGLEFPLAEFNEARSAVSLLVNPTNLTRLWLVVLRRERFVVEAARQSLPLHRCFVLTLLGGGKAILIDCGGPGQCRRTAATSDRAPAPRPAIASPTNSASAIGNCRCQLKRSFPAAMISAIFPL